MGCRHRASGSGPRMSNRGCHGKSICSRVISRWSRRPQPADYPVNTGTGEKVLGGGAEGSGEIAECCGGTEKGYATEAQRHRGRHTELAHAASGLKQRSIRSAGGPAGLRPAPGIEENAVHTHALDPPSVLVIGVLLDPCRA